MPVYKIYGLHISSSIVFKGVPISNETFDIELNEGIVPDCLSETTFKSGFFESNHHQLLIRFRSQVRFLLSNGRQVEFQILETHDSEELQQFILGPVLAALLHQRGEVPLHASTIVFNNKAVVFAGESGSGKSTLAASFVNKGYSLLADDVSLVSIDINRKCFIQPAVPLMKFWDDSLEFLNISSEQTCSLSENITKKGWAIDKHFNNSPKELSAIFIMQKVESDNVSIVQLKGSEKIKYLYDVIFRSYFVRGLDTQQQVFEKMTTIAKNTSIFLIQRPQNQFTLPEIHAKVLELL